MPEHCNILHIMFPVVVADLPDRGEHQSSAVQAWAGADRPPACAH